MRNTGQSAGKRWDKWQGQQKDIKKVPFHGTEEEWKRIQREREKDNTALLFIVIIGGIVGVGLLISRQ